MLYVSYISIKPQKEEIRALGALRKEQELEKASWRRGSWSWVCLRMCRTLGKKRREIRGSQMDKSWGTKKLTGDKGGEGSRNWWAVRAVFED